jgi:hypothetical protein
MGWQLIWLGLAVVCAGGSFLLFRHLYRDRLKHLPVTLHLSGNPLSNGGRQFGAIVNDDHAVGKIGEMITGLMMAAGGWRQLPSQPGGVHGLDGMFLRHLHGSGAYEIQFVETKTSRDGNAARNYAATQMTDEKLLAELEKLQQPEYMFEGKPYIEASVARAISHAIRHKSMWVSKKLFSHTLSTGTTVVFPIGEHGQLLRRPASIVKTISDEPHRYLFQSLAIGLARLDHTGAFKIDGGVAMQAQGAPPVVTEAALPETAPEANEIAAVEASNDADAIEAADEPETRAAA